MDNERKYVDSDPLLLTSLGLRLGLTGPLSGDEEGETGNWELRHKLIIPEDVDGDHVADQIE